MKPDDEFDAYLTRQLDVAALPAEDFVRVVTGRLRRHRRLRFWALSGAVVVAGVIAAVAVYLSPAPAPAVPAITPEAIVATLLLITGCSLVWIGTESGPLRRPEP